MNMVYKKLIVCSLLLLMITGLVAGCSPQTTGVSGQAAVDKQTAQNKDQAAGADKEAAAHELKVTLYFAAKDAKHVIPEVRTLPASEHPATAAVEALLAGPQNKDLKAVFPNGTKLRSLTVKEHTAYVDFSDKLVKNANGGSAMEILLVGALVNTLTEFPDIEKVRILVDGKAIDTISGHMDLSEPLSRSESIIKKM